MKRKLIALILAALMLCTSFALVSVSAAVLVPSNIKFVGGGDTDEGPFADGEGYVVEADETSITVFVWIQDLTDEDDLGAYDLSIGYDAEKLEVTDFYGKVGSGKKAYKYSAEYFSTPTYSPLDVNPLHLVGYNFETENQCWDSEWGLNEDAWVCIDFDFIGDWEGITELDLSADLIKRNVDRDVLECADTTITIQRGEAPVEEVSNTLFVTGPATVNGTAITEKTEYAPEFGTLYTVTATGEGFKYWTNNGAIFSFDATIEFIADDVTTVDLVPVYAEKAETLTVTYKDGLTGKIYKVDKVDAGTVLAEGDMPTAAAIPGYTFSACKTLNADGKYVAAIGFTVEADAEVILFHAKDNSTTYTLTVDNGSNVQDYVRSFGAIATVGTALENFSCWVDENGTVLSFDKTFKFVMPNSNFKLTAVENADLDIDSVLEVVSNQLSNGNIITTFARDLADGCTFIDAGILYTRKGTEADLIDPKESPYVTQGISTSSDPVYGFVKNVEGKTGTWLIRGYMNYTDANGQPCCIYTDVVTVVVD
ncbi:MAG: hypothetical protein IKT43_01080 [Clostridia bacterium]|nr:hypothetical protein [Clostridia bacterium]